MPTGRPARSQLLLYGALAFPLSFAGLPLYLHAPDFYATSLLQPLAVLGAVLLALRVIDAAQDPLIGAISDRYADHRPTIIIGGAALLLLGFAGLFNPTVSPLSGGYTLAWFALCVFLCTTGFSIVTINYQALGGLWDVASGDRTKVTGTREALSLVGILAASILPAVLQAHTDPKRSFSLLSLLLIPVFLAGIWLLFRWFRTQPHSPDKTVQAHPATRPGLSALLRDSWARRFYGVFFVSNLASAIPAVLVLFYVRDRLQAEQFTGLFLVIYFASGAAFLPLWERAAARIGKAKTWAISMVLAIVTFLWAFTLSEGDIVPFAIVCVLSGSALGADLAIPPAMVADRIDAAGDRERASRYFAANAFCAKSALALATGLSLPVLGLLGYQPGQPIDAGVGLSLAVVYALVPCVIKAVSAVWLFRVLPVMGARH